MNTRPHMNIYSLQADLCKALAHPIRLQILDLLSEREQTVEELNRAVGIGQSSLSQHLAALRQRRLVIARRAGINVYYKLSNPMIDEACNLTRKLLVELLEQDHRAVKKIEV
jgi:DNA-binding transcriptional ArsR family regulator